jgi:Uma2 family endonuclease
MLIRWLARRLERYVDEHPEVINFVATPACVLVPGEDEATAPEPDLAAYRDFPLQLPLEEIRWEDVSPILVAEIISRDTADKDFVRNVELYLAVPSIREYWIFDTRESHDTPKLTVYRKRGQRWQRPIVVPFGEIYTPERLLPGFTLRIDPRA